MQDLHYHALCSNVIGFFEHDSCKDGKFPIVN